MTNLNISQAIQTSNYIGGFATGDLFGANFLFARDGAWRPGEVSQPYMAFATEVGLTNLRYPGGTMTEELFDMANPNNQGDTTNGKKGLVPLSTFLDYAASIGASATIVVPTYRLFTDKFDAEGQRVISANAESLVRNFVQYTLHEAARAGASIQGFELGNEWWVDNTAIFGFRMNPIEYGRMANFLAKTIQEEIESFNATQASWSRVDPDIIVQVGPGGNAEWYSLWELGLADRGSTKQISATEAIFHQIVDPAAKSAIDGTVTHRYLVGTDQAISGWTYKPFMHWDALANNDPHFNREFTRYVTEWNVRASNPVEVGIRQFDSMILLTREMMVAGVDLANVWAVQQNNNTKMIYNTGLKEASYSGLTYGGVAFDMMAAQLPGLRAISSSGTIAGLQLVSFGSDSKTVLFLTNKSGTSRNDQLIKSTLPAGTTHVSIYEVTEGSDGRPTVAVRTFPINEMPSTVLLSFSIEETVMIVFARSGLGIAIEGYNLDDNLVGTLGGDSITGGHGSDTLFGSSGNDTIRGEEGNDLLIGGDGDDFFDASLGADTIVGGQGSDTVFFGTLAIDRAVDLAHAEAAIVSFGGVSFGSIENVIAGDGNDTILGSNLGNLVDGSGGVDFLQGRGGNDTIKGGDGNDFLLGGEGNDIVCGGDGGDFIDGDEGDDWIVGGMGDDFLFGGAGDDFVEAGDGNDALQGKDGSDVLQGGARDDTLFGGAGTDRSFGGIGDDIIFCEDGDDVGNGGGGNDTIIGGGGADSLLGMDGSDILIGGADAGAPASLLRSVFNPDGSSLVIYNLFAEGSAAYRSMEGDYLSGGQGDDILLGGGGSDYLSGDLGDDWIFGFGGDDVMRGGLGRDSFVLSTEGSGRTTVMDFSNNIDTLVLVGRFGDSARSLDSFVDRFSSIVDEGMLFHFDDGAEIILCGVSDRSMLHDDLLLFNI
ncbi:MAG: calcium-binding protein [Polynucleobacter sp.]|nr:calcium-binding protein [Polynucleobacter sp.]